MFTTNVNVARRLTQAVVAAGAMTVLSTGVALAWHPHGVITKGVTNVTAGDSATLAADTLGTAVSAKPGDTLKYTIVLKNDSPTSNSYDDLLVTKFEDTLPAGVTLVSGKITENLGTVKAKQLVTRTLTVKVNANAKDGDVLDNKACFNGEATNHEQGTQQSGCDHAIVKVHVPKTTPSPTPSPSPSKSPTPSPSPSKSPTPSPTKTPEILGAATELPKTGAPVLGSAIGLGAMVASSAAYIRSRRAR